MDLVEPGVTTVEEWRGEDAPAVRPLAKDTAIYGGLARLA